MTETIVFLFASTNKRDAFQSNITERTAFLIEQCLKVSVGMSLKYRNHMHTDRNQISILEHYCRFSMYHTFFSVFSRFEVRGEASTGTIYSFFTAYFPAEFLEESSQWKTRVRRVLAEDAKFERVSDENLPFFTIPGLSPID